MTSFTPSCKRSNSGPPKRLSTFFFSFTFRRRRRDRELGSDWSSSVRCAPPSAVALGAFDGIHLAHQKILDLATARARALGASAVACTFDPHPLQVLRPGQAPEPITTLAERLELIGARGIDLTVVIPFTLEFSRVEPEAFVEDVLVGTLREN